MTHVGPAPVTSATSAGASFVEWGAVLAGAFLAAAISFVLLTFGAAIGLSATSPWPNSGVSAKLIATLAVLWAMMQQIGAFMVGGYVAGRMRSRWHETTQHEVEFRDGLHGGLVWAVGIVIGAALAMAAAGAAAKTGIDVAGKAAATSVTALSTTDPMDAVLDTMLRPTTVAQAAGASTPPAAGAPAPTASRARSPAAGSDETRSELARVLASAVAGGGLSEQNRTYLAQLVAQRSGLSQQEAERRVNEAFTAAREAADKARKTAILTGFVTAASLIISFGAAWWAALRGGQHRDNAVPARFAFGRNRRPDLAS
ncbi:MAG TPA: hypothetical protein VFR19_20545 [Hyphomicrobiaceae bacterium]|jgi:hypothetical protein|nr:hypothetical protein [Hyphomicrobiaceae bacterium]